MNNLSIITVVRNDFNGIKKTYNSIIDLLNHGAKWIVIDGGDDADTNVWFSHKSKYNIKYIREDDSGIYDAMNKGLELAGNNDYLWFLNSADQNTLDHYLVNSNLLQAKENNFDIIKFDCTVNGTNRREIINKKFLIFNSPNHQSIFVNKKLHNKFYTDLKLAADYANFVDIFFMHNPNILYVHHSIVEYDLNGITAQQNQKNAIRFERLKSSYRCFKSTKNLFSAIIFLIQIIIYTPFFVFPNTKLKRFKD
jgi:hypothetical protein